MLSYRPTLDAFPPIPPTSLILSTTEIWIYSRKMNRLIDELVNERVQEEVNNNFQNWDYRHLKHHIDTYKTLLIKGIITDSNVSSLELGGLDFENIVDTIGQSSTISGQFTDTVAHRGVLYAWVDKAHHMLDNKLKRMRELLPTTADSYQAKMNFVTNLTKARNPMALNDFSLIKFDFLEERAKTEDREILRPGSAFLGEADLNAPFQPPPRKSEEKEMNSPVVNDDQPVSNIAYQRNDEESVKSSDAPEIIKNKQTPETPDEPGINRDDLNPSKLSKKVQWNLTDNQQITKESNSDPQANQKVKESTTHTFNIPADNENHSQGIASIITDKSQKPLAESTRQSIHNAPASNTPKSPPAQAHNTELNSNAFANPANKPPQESNSAQPSNKNEQGDRPTDEPVMDEPKTIKSDNGSIDAQNLPEQIIPADAFNFIGTGAPPPSPVKSTPIQAHTEGGKHTPTESTKHTPTEGTKHAPTACTKHTPAKGEKHAPAKGAKHVPAKGEKHAPAEEYENNDVDLGGNEMELLDDEVPSSVGSLVEYPSQDDNIRAERANRISPSSSGGSQIERSPQKRKREPPPPPPENDNERENRDSQEDLGNLACNPDELRFNQSESTTFDTDTGGSKRKVSKKDLYFRRQGIRDPELPAPKRKYRERAPRRVDAPPHHPASDDGPRNEMMQEMGQEEDLPSFDMDLRNADPRDSGETSLDSSPLDHDSNEPHNDSFGIPLDNYDYPMEDQPPVEDQQPMEDQHPGAPTTGDFSGQDVTHKIIYSEQFSKKVEGYLGFFDPDGVNIQELVQRIADKENEFPIYIYTLLMNDMGINYAPLELSNFNEPINITTTKVAIRDTSADEEDNNSLKLVKACLNNLRQARLKTKIAEDPCGPKNAGSQQKKSKQEDSEQKDSEQEDHMQEEARLVSQQVKSPIEINSTQTAHARTENVQDGGSQDIPDNC